MSHRPLTETACHILQTLRCTGILAAKFRGEIYCIHFQAVKTVGDFIWYFAGGKVHLMAWKNVAYQISRSFKIHVTDLCGDIILSDMSLLLSVGLPNLQNLMDGDFICQMWHVSTSYMKMYPAPSLNIASKSWISAAVWWIKTCGPTIAASKWNGLNGKWLQPVRQILSSLFAPLCW